MCGSLQKIYPVLTVLSLVNLKDWRRVELALYKIYQVPIIDNVYIKPTNKACSRLGWEIVPRRDGGIGLTNIKARQEIATQGLVQCVLRAETIRQEPRNGIQAKQKKTHQCVIQSKYAQARSCSKHGWDAHAMGYINSNRTLNQG